MKTAWMQKSACCAARWPLALNFLTILCLNLLFSTQTLASSLVALRSDQSALPESIRRETFAAIDRSRASLLALARRDGLWSLQDGSSTVFPTLAFCDPEPTSQANVVALSLAASLNKIESTISKPWSKSQAMEAAYTVLAEAINSGRPSDPRVLTRLSRVQRSTLEWTDSALLLMAQEANDIPMPGGWQAVVNSLRLSTASDVTAVTIAAIGRLKSRPNTLGRPREDVLAHVRWIAGRIALSAPNPLVADGDVITPEAAFFITMLAAQLPRQLLAEDSTLLPYNWRNHLANRLLAQQRKDPATGLDYWDTATSPSPNSDSALRATTYAVMTLVILAE